MAAGRAVGDYGREHGLPPLYEPQSEGAFLDRIALIAPGVVDLKATYTAPAGETRILLGLDHPSLALPEPEVPRLMNLLSAVLQSGLVRDWPAALRAYERARGLRFDELIEFEFDDLGRLTRLRSRLG